MPDHSIALDVGRMSARYRPGAPIDKAKKNRHLNFMGVLENQCLVLNRSWQAVNVITVQAALSMMAADAATGSALKKHPIDLARNVRTLQFSSRPISA